MKFLTWFIESFLVARLLSVGPAKSVCWTKRLPQIIYLGWESTSLRQRWRIDACFHCMPIKYRWKKSIKTIYNGRGNSKLLYILNAVVENTRGQRVFQEQSMKEADNWFLEENSLFGLGGLGHRLIVLMTEIRTINWKWPRTWIHVGDIFTFYIHCIFAFFFLTAIANYCYTKLLRVSQWLPWQFSILATKSWYLG